MTRSPRAWALAAGIVLSTALVGTAPLSAQPVKVTIRDEKPQVFEPVLPVDPLKRITYQMIANLSIRLRPENKTAHLGYIYNFFKIDNRVLSSTRSVYFNRMLTKSAGGRVRHGVQGQCLVDKIRVTQTVEAVPGKSPGDNTRRLDTCVVHYVLENTDTVNHKVGMRVGMDMYMVSNDGALFAAPNFPGKILDGVELKGDKVPRYLQVLQRPDLKNPGFVAHFTYGLGSGVEPPSRVVLTGLRAQAADGWNLQAVPANGDSAMSMYWDEKELRPNEKRQLAYAYGKGLASGIGYEGNLVLDLGGSFEPGKTFTIAAYVYDPAPGQALTLELPPGMQRVEGSRVEPVPILGNEGKSLVLWKARVERPGEYRLSVHSSNGLIQSKIISITLDEATK